MALLYADENVDHKVVEHLRTAGHDVLTALEDGRANQGIPDPNVLARATQLSRAVLTGNRHHYHKLPRANSNHSGIITFTDDRDVIGLAGRIDAAISPLDSLARKLIKIIRPSRPPSP